MISEPPSFIPTTSGPLSLEFLGHTNVASFDAEAEFANAALHYANLYWIHRDTMDLFAEAFTPWLEKFSGIDRGIDEKLTEKAKSQAVNPSKVTPIPLRFVPFLKKVWAKADKPQQKLIQAEALRVSRLIRINVAPAERKMPIAPMFYSRADSILEGDLETINEKCSRFLSLVPNFELARDSFDKPIRESLARLLQKFDAARWANED